MTSALTDKGFAVVAATDAGGALRHLLSGADCDLLFTDIDLGAGMDGATLAQLVHAMRPGLPIVYTEQYSKGLGPTIPALKELLDGAHRVEKLSFSCALPEVVSALKRSQILIAGMETHVCVFQSTRDLAEQGFDSYLLADAVLSRTEEDRQVGLSLCREVGAVVTTVESALFDLLGKAGTPEFKLISAAVK